MRSPTPRPRVLRASAQTRSLLLLLLAALLVVAVVIPITRRPSRWTADRQPPPGFEEAITDFDSGKTESGLAELSRMRGKWTHPRWDRRADFLSGYWLARTGSSGGASRILLRVASENRSGPDDVAALRSHAKALLGSVLLRAGRHEEARKAVEPLARDFELFPVGEDALETWTMATARSGRRAEAIARLDQILRDGKAESPERFLLLLARIKHDGGDDEGAGATYKRVYCLYPKSAFADQAMDLLAALPRGARMWTRDDLPLLEKRAGTLVEAGDLAGAVETWDEARQRIDAGSTDPSLRARLGIALVAARRYAEAEPLLLEAPSDPTLARRVLLARARIAVSQKRRARAESILKPLLPPGAEATARAEAEQILADALEDVDDRPGALKHYRTSLGLLAGSPDEDSLLWKTGWLALTLGRNDEALSLFRRLRRPDVHPGYQAAATYWSGRVHESRKRSAEAQMLFRETFSRFRNDYYGLRAGVRLGLDMPPSPRLSTRNAGSLDTVRAPTALTASLSKGTAADGSIEKAADPDPADYPSPERDAVAAGLELESLHLRSEAAAAYAFALRAHPKDRALNLKLADLFLARGDRLEALPYLRAAYPDLLTARAPMIPARHREALYPLDQWEQIRRAAARQSLDPFLVCALILQESAFNPLALSRAGAMGLMQIVPSTGQQLARKTGAGAFEKEKLFDPSFNIALGTAYLSDILDEFDGRIEPALAAYNAGLSRANRWWAESRGDTERFVEDIPLTETRLYVKRILAGRRMYILLYSR